MNSPMTALNTASSAAEAKAARPSSRLTRFFSLENRYLAPLFITTIQSARWKDAINGTTL